MIREIVHIATSKSILQEIFNCWLSYTMAQPMNFDLPVLISFSMRYVGIAQIGQLITHAKYSVQRLVDEMNEQEMGEVFAEQHSSVN